jgi:tetratricopeptide (TPR) repeat protein
MRNIEEIAVEEEIRSRRGQRQVMRKVLTVAGLGMGLWGWILFSQGSMGPGALWITLSLAALLAAWGAHRLHPFPAFAWGGAFLVSLPVFLLDALTQAPSFYWGRDPDFFLAVQAGEVVRPIWSPLVYLAGQAASFVFPSGFFTLPMLSVGLTALSFFCLALWWFALVRDRKPRAFLMIFLLACAAALSRPFWDAGTIASGSVDLLGLLLFGWQRLLLNAGEARGENVGLLSGLLFSTHPAWGLLGLLNLILADHREFENKTRAFFFFILGLTPFFWVTLRPLQFFPSWGGSAPFQELFWEAPKLLSDHLRFDWNLLQSLSFWGWALVPLLAAALFFRAAGGAPPPKRDFWIGLTALGLATLSASSASERLGPTALWAVAALVENLIRAGEKQYDRKSGGGLSQGIWTLGVGAAALLACAAVWMPGQACVRNGFLFPQAHALNLIRGMKPQGVLVCEDPFEAGACRAARLSEPLTAGVIILDQDELNQKWYLSQIIGKDSGLLFSKINGSTQSILDDLIVSNLDSRELDWAVPRLPGDWNGPVAVPTLLTERFTLTPPSADEVEDAQARCDLSELLRAKSFAETDGLTRHYYHRYVEGFDNLGEWLLSRRQYSAAIRGYERALSLDPDDSVSKQSLALIYTQDNLLEAARMDFEKIVKTYPARLKQVMGEMDRVKTRNGENDAQVISLLNETVRLNSVLADAQYHLGELYQKEGNVKAAQNLLESAVRMNPQRLESQMALGLLMEQTGNRQQAEEALRGVLKIDPQNKQAQTELWKLLNKS